MWRSAYVCNLFFASFIFVFFQDLQANTGLARVTQVGMTSILLGLNLKPWFRCIGG